MSGEYEEQVKGEKMEDMEEKEEKLTLEKFEEATEAVSKVISETKLVYSEHFSNMTGNKVYFKPENMQYTGAYKVRGAYYKISTLSEEEKSRGLITASAGNHAQGVAYAAKLAGSRDRHADHNAPYEGQQDQKLWGRSGTPWRRI